MLRLLSVWVHLLFLYWPLEGGVELYLHRQHRDAAGDKTKEKMIFAAIRQRKQNLMEMEMGGEGRGLGVTKHFRMQL